MIISAVCRERTRMGYSGTHLARWGHEKKSIFHDQRSDALPPASPCCAQAKGLLHNAVANRRRMSSCPTACFFRKTPFAAVIALLLLFAPMLNAEMLRMEASVEAMGSAYSIVAYDEDRYVLQAAVDAAFDEVRRLDGLLSNYKPASELSKINQLAADHPVVVSQEVFDLLAACLEYSRLSEGAFDITVGDLMKVWGFYKGSGHLPKSGEVQEALKTVGWRKVRLDPGKSYGILH